VLQTRNGNTSGSVNLYTEDGAHVTESSLQRSALPTVIAWHPTQQLLATGWANGELIVWNQATHSANQCEQVHEAAISAIVWSADGSHFVSGDLVGVASMAYFAALVAANLPHAAPLPPQLLTCCPHAPKHSFLWAVCVLIVGHRVSPSAPPPPC